MSDPTTAAPPSPAELAARAEDAIRALTYATLPWEQGLEYPGDVYDVLGSLKVLAMQLPQVCDQLASFLTAQHTAGLIRAVEGQPFAGDTGDAVGTAVLWLGKAGAAADALHEAWNNTQTATAGLAYAGPHDDDAGAPDA